MKAAGVAENNVYARESGYSNAIENSAIIGKTSDFVNLYCPPILTDLFCLYGLGDIFDPINDLSENRILIKNLRRQNFYYYSNSGLCLKFARCANFVDE